MVRQDSSSFSIGGKLPLGLLGLPGRVLDLLHRLYERFSATDATHLVEF